MPSSQTPPFPFQQRLSSLAPYAVRADNPTETRRAHGDNPDGKPPESYRSAFQRDRARILHCAAFRRLQRKTQVFIPREGDHHRTRLTHTLEVSQIAHGLARALGGDEDLAEAVALAHDLGHPPFSHRGEDVLNQCLKTHNETFDHNVQSLRIVFLLESPYPNHRGVNLTHAALEGVVKHNGPVHDKSPMGVYLKHAQTEHSFPNLNFNSYASLEAQCAAVADDIAYNAHDMLDGLRAGYLHEDILAEESQLARNAFASLPDNLPRSVRQHEAARRLIGALVTAVVNNASKILTRFKPQSADDVRNLPQSVAELPQNLNDDLLQLKNVLMRLLYRGRPVMRSRAKAQQVIQDLFSLYMENPGSLPSETNVDDSPPAKSSERAHRVRDFIAGMTDDFAIEEHRALFDLHDTWGRHPRGPEPLP